MKKQIITAAILFTIIPAVSMAGPLVGIGYADIGLSGHSGRPGIGVFAGNKYHNDVIANGKATFASGFYSMNVSIGKLIKAGGVGFEPYASLGFLNLNYQQQETGYHTTTTTSGGGFGYPPVTYSYTTPYSYTSPQSIQDFYGLAGANLVIPISNKVGVGIGGGFGHTLSTFGGSGGSVYKGNIAAAFKVARHITASLDVSYTHVPGASLTCYGAGLAYHF